MSDYPQIVNGGEFGVVHSSSVTPVSLEPSSVTNQSPYNSDDIKQFLPEKWFIYGPVLIKNLKEECYSKLPRKNSFYVYGTIQNTIQ